MSQSGIQVESILVPKGDFYLLKGKHVKDVFLVVDSLEIPLPSNILKEGLLCWNIDNSAFYKYNGTNWAPYSLVKAGNGMSVNAYTSEIGLSSFGSLSSSVFLQGNGLSTNFILQLLNLFNISAKEIRLQGNTTNLFFETANLDGANINLKSQNFKLIDKTTDENIIVLNGKDLYINSTLLDLNTANFRNIATPKNIVDLTDWHIPVWKNVVEVAVKREAITFGQKNWVGSNVVLKRTDVADLNFYTVKRNAKLTSLLINAGSVAGNEIFKNITVEVYQKVASNFSMTQDPTLTVSEIQAVGTLVYSVTTVVAGTNQASTNFQRVFENLNVSIPQYYHLYVVLTVNELSSLNNLSVQLELQEA